MTTTPGPAAAATTTTATKILYIYTHSFTQRKTVALATHVNSINHPPISLD